MTEAFRLGGFGMYPTTVAGLLMVAAAVQYARDPQRARLALVRGLAVLTALTGTLGFVSGVIKSLIAAGQEDGPQLVKFVVIGTGESLHNVGLSLVMLVAAAIATCIGAYRAVPRLRAAGGASPVDPHAK